MKRMGSAAAVLLTASLAGGLVAAAPPALGVSASPGIITTFAGGEGRGVDTTVAQQPTTVATGPGGAVYVGDADDWVMREFTSTSSFEHVVAGLGPNGVSTGSGGLATQTALPFYPTGSAVDGAGNLIFATDGPVWALAATSGTFYGRAMTAGHLYKIASIKYGFGVAIDHSGNVVIATFDNERVKVLAASTGTFYGQAMTAGHLYTIAGTGTAGYNGDGIPATSAELTRPRGLAIDAAGNVVLADTQNFRVRVIAAVSGTFYGQAMTAGDIYTIAGTGTSGYTGDGGPATSAELSSPDTVAVDQAGNVLIPDEFNNRIRVVAAASGTFYGQAMTAGDIYTIAGTGRNGYSGNDGPATKAELNAPEGIAVDAAGNVVIADTSNHRVRVIAATSGTFYHRAMTAGDIYTVAGNGYQYFSGDGSSARNAELEANGVAVSESGDVVISDPDHSRIRVVAGSSGTRYGMTLRAGDIYTIAGNGKDGYSGDGGPGTAAELANPGWPATDSAGNVIIADQLNNRIRVVAAVSGTFYGQAMTAGDIYTIAGNGTQGYSGDGGPATAAELNFPDGVTVDAHGNVLIADTGNYRVRVVAAASGTFYGQAMTAGDIYTIAGTGTAGYSGDGGPATAAELSADDVGLAVDQSGNVIIADRGNYRVRVVAAASGTFYGQAMTAGDIYTIAGTGAAGYSGDGGPATSAELGGPAAVAVDGAGNLIIADIGNSRVRVVAAASGTFYGQAMTAGDIYTIAGNGDSGFAGDGGPGTSARVDPSGVAVNGAGDVLIADGANDRIREVFG
jgi:trimeric autotransporter adhesin